MKSLCTLLTTVSVLFGISLVMRIPSAFAQNSRTTIRAGETVLGEFRSAPPNVGASGVAITNVNTYTFHANAGDRIHIRAFPNGSLVQSSIVPLITLTDPLGNPFEVDSPRGLVIVPSALMGGAWTVSLSSRGNITGDYALSVEVIDTNGNAIRGINQPFGHEINF